MQNGRLIETQTIVVDHPTLRREAGPGGCHLMVTPPVAPDFQFDDVIPSWNVRGNFRAMIRVRFVGADDWSAWDNIGTWGDAPPTRAASRGDVRVTIDVDRLRAGEPLRAAQLAFDSVEALTVDRVSLCLSRVSAFMAAPAPVTVHQGIDLPVPFRSQQDSPPAIASRSCSPTCVAMLLAYHGIDVPAPDVAAACFDPDHDLYGNWNRAIQAACTFGLPGCVRRFAGWADALEHVHAGRPIIASIAFEEGVLPAAPLPRTDGHLVVVRGFERDAVMVNDPAGPSGSGPMRYPMAAFGPAWFGHGGVAYVFDGGAAGPETSCDPRVF